MPIPALYKGLHSRRPHAASNEGNDNIRDRWCQKPLCLPPQRENPTFHGRVARKSEELQKFAPELLKGLIGNTATELSTELNICDLNLEDDDEECGNEFSTVKKIDASENMLSLYSFYQFPELLDLNLALNHIYSIPELSGKLTNLKCLDLSYNFVNGPEAVERLGVLPNLVQLSLTGNGLTKLSDTMAPPITDENEECACRFGRLEVLHLDDNMLSGMEDFAILATLPNLRILNLAKNRFRSVPLLKSESNVSEDCMIQIAENFKQAEASDSEQSIQEIPAEDRIQHFRPSIAPGGSCMKKGPMAVCGVCMPQPGAPTKHSTKERRTRFVAEIFENHAQTDGLRSHNQPCSTLSGYDLLLHEPRTSTASPPRVRVADEYFNQSNIPKMLHMQRKARYGDKINRHERCGLLDTRHFKGKGRVKASDPKHSHSNVNRNDLKTTPVLSLSVSQRDGKSSYVTPPFPSLQQINLSHNQIRYEENILPIAVWPQLKELVIHDNPLVRQHSGMPPLLDRLLVHRLNMNVRRTKQDCSWFDTTGNIVRQEPLEKELMRSSADANKSQLAIRAPLPMLKHMPICKGALTTSGTRTKHHALEKAMRRFRLVVPNRLTAKDLSMGPRVTRCNPDQELNRLRMETQELSKSAAQRCTPLALVSPNNASDLQADNYAPRNSNEEVSDPSSHAVDNCRSSHNGSFKNGKDGNEEEHDDDTGIFFTTQLTDFMQSSSPVRHSGEPQPDFSAEPEIDEDTGESTSSPPPLLPHLPWIVDEDRLPKTMQACLQELRYWHQHRPTIHVKPPITLQLANHTPASNDKPVISGDISLQLQAENKCLQHKRAMMPEVSTTQIEVHEQNPNGTTDTYEPEHTFKQPRPPALFDQISNSPIKADTLH